MHTMATRYPSPRSAGSNTGSFAGVRRFFAWWWRELSALVPAGLKPFPPSVRRFLWVEFAAGHAVVRRHEAGQSTELGRVDLNAGDPAARKLAFEAMLGRYRRQPIGLAIPAGQLLRRHIRLPVAARDNLRQVIGFELGRHTPFNGDQAWFDYREAGSESKTGGIEVAVAVAARAPLDQALSVLREWGRFPSLAVPSDEIGTTARYGNLLPLHLRPRGSWRSRLFFFIMVLVPLFLLFAALAVPLWQKREVVFALQAEAGQARARAEAIDGLRQSLDQASAEYVFLLERKLRRPASVMMLEDLTRLLPDDTWLNQLEIKGPEVILSGETRSSSSLIRTLDKSVYLQESGFRSPLVKGRNNVERFQVAAKIKEISLDEAIAAQRAIASDRKKPRARKPADAKEAP
ncbi:MAG: PilN domain-containing protein [Pseudomonadota bacterium]